MARPPISKKWLISKNWLIAGPVHLSGYSSRSWHRTRCRRLAALPARNLSLKISPWYQFGYQLIGCCWSVVRLVWP